MGRYEREIYRDAHCLPVLTSLRPMIVHFVPVDSTSALSCRSNSSDHDADAAGAAYTMDAGTYTQYAARTYMFRPKSPQIEP